MNNSENFLNQDNDSIDIVKEIRYYLFFWPWFLASIFLVSTAVYFYLRYANTVYSTSATVQVKEASSDPSSFLSQGSGAMFDFGKVKIDNFIAQISSKPNLSEVVDRLDLQTQVYSIGRVKNSLQFGDAIPFQIIFKTKSNYLINLLISPSKTFFEIDEVITFFDPSVPFENENFMLVVNANNVENELNFRIDRSSKLRTVENLSSSINISSSSKTGDNIDISLLGTNEKRNEAIVNTLIDVGQLQQKDDKQEIFALSIDFINNRLVSIKNEIDTLTLQTTGFKADNSIFSPQVQTTTALNKITTSDQQQFNLSTQKALAKSLKENLENQADYNLLPANIGLESANVNELLFTYNELVLKRKNLLSGATTINPLVIQLSDQLSDLKTNVLTSVNNYISNIETSLIRNKEFENKTNLAVSKIPNLEASLSGFERKFQIAEKLYLFLLERREEASISFEATLPDMRVINYAHTDFTPVSPKKTTIGLLAILLALLVPFVVLFLLKLIDTKIHTREALEKLVPNIDILGEIPFIEDIQSITDSRGIFAESSRVIRSNISFKLRKEQSNVILCTSTIKGEGKTLTAFNTAASYVATGKKVLLIGADLRNPQLHNLINMDRKNDNKGLSNLIANADHDLPKDCVKSIPLFNNQLDILLSGPIPPNPAELLDSKTFLNIIEEFKKSYDYIIIDSAPLLLVSDTLPLLIHADLVLYTTRAHYTDEKLIPFIKSIVEDKKVTSIGLVFNGIKAGATSYYKYGYSYRYSYTYKYNYGYGYGYGEDKS